MKYVNLTPHKIVVDNGKRRLEIEPSGSVARVEKEEKIVDIVDGFEVFTQSGMTVDLGVYLEQDVVYIVSAMVLEAYKVLNTVQEHLVVAPNTNKARRNERGHIISVPGFVR